MAVNIPIRYASEKSAGSLTHDDLELLFAPLEG
jgi:hypothetical protein